ncbi:DUF4062 domain-containing protein [Candidatus Poribacteria bacterium]|nr:DUF4062 domain-containing protein [Candidatus Poribacteria bacterium]MYF23339.1 DUF4062 domain-containing protein [Chloroflexota bacterium]
MSGHVRVFLSSVIAGYEDFRDAAARGITSLGYEVSRAEDFGASAATPQQACLAAVREADLVVLVLGARYGALQGSGLSATHEEYHETRGSTPVLVFVQDGIDDEPEQAQFIREVQQWESGNLTQGFTSPEELQGAVTKEVHRHALSGAGEPIADDDLLDLARDHIQGGASHWHEPQLVLSLAAAPRQEILRPSELEDGKLSQWIQREALFGSSPLFVTEIGTDSTFRGNWLMLTQGVSTIEIEATGSIVVRQPALSRGSDHFTLPVLIEEDIEERLGTALQFSSKILDHIDPVRRLAQVALVVEISDATHQAWQSRAEHMQSPNSISVGMHQGPATAHLTPVVRGRAGLGLQSSTLARDLTVLLRRELQSGHRDSWR